MNRLAVRRRRWVWTADRVSPSRIGASGEQRYGGFSFPQSTSEGTHPATSRSFKRSREARKRVHLNVSVMLCARTFADTRLVIAQSPRRVWPGPAVVRPAARSLPSDVHYLTLAGSWSYRRQYVPA